MKDKILAVLFAISYLMISIGLFLYFGIGKGLIFSGSFLFIVLILFQIDWCNAK